MSNDESLCDLLVRSSERSGRKATGFRLTPESASKKIDALPIEGPSGWLRRKRYNQRDLNN
jgi:hypothetical protein